MSINISKFNIAKMRCDRACVLIGASGTGKSHLATTLLSVANERPGGISMALIFCGTHEGDPYWSKFCPETFIYDTFDEDKVEQLINVQKKIQRKIDKIQENIDLRKRTGEDTQALQHRVTTLTNSTRKAIILDDVSWDKKILKLPCIRKLFMCGRHWNIFVMLTLQYAIDLPIDLRGNAGYVFCCRENILAYRKRIWEQFYGMVTLPVFQHLLDGCTQNYDVLVLDRTIASSKVGDVVFWYHAPPTIPHFHIGDARLWKFCHTNYNPNYLDQKERKEKVTKVACKKSKTMR